MISFCGKCKAKYTLPDERKGIRFRCKTCGNVVYTDDKRRIESVPAVASKPAPVPVKPEPKAEFKAKNTAMFDALEDDLFDFSDSSALRDDVVSQAIAEANAEQEAEQRAAADKAQAKKLQELKPVQKSKPVAPKPMANPAALKVKPEVKPETKPAPEKAANAAPHKPESEKKSAAPKGAGKSGMSKSGKFKLGKPMPAHPAGKARPSSVRMKGKPFGAKKSPVPAPSEPVDVEGINIPVENSGAKNDETVIAAADQTVTVFAESLKDIQPDESSAEIAAVKDESAELAVLPESSAVAENTDDEFALEDEVEEEVVPQATAPVAEEDSSDSEDILFFDDESSAEVPAAEVEDVKESVVDDADDALSFSDEEDETLSPVELAVAEEPLVSAEDNAEELELDISGVDDLAAVDGLELEIEIQSDETPFEEDGVAPSEVGAEEKAEVPDEEVCLAVEDKSAVDEAGAELSEGAGEVVLTDDVANEPAEINAEPGGAVAVMDSSEGKIIFGEEDLDFFESDEKFELAPVVDLAEVFPLNQRILLATCKKCDAKYRLPEKYGNSSSRFACALCHDTVEIVINNDMDRQESSYEADNMQIEIDSSFAGEKEELSVGDDADEVMVDVAQADYDNDSEPESVEIFMDDEVEEKSEMSEGDSLDFIDVADADEGDIFVEEEVGDKVEINDDLDMDEDDLAGEESGAEEDDSDSEESAAGEDDLDAEKDSSKVSVRPERKVNNKPAVGEGDEDLFDFGEATKLASQMTGTDSSLFGGGSGSSIVKNTESDDEDDEEALVQW